MKQNWHGTTTVRDTADDAGQALRANVVSSASITGRHRRASNAGLPAEFISVPAETRMAMARIAREAVRAEDALVPVIELLVGDGGPAKRAAIVTAFRTNAALREQWERTYEILRKL